MPNKLNSDGERIIEFLAQMADDELSLTDQDIERESDETMQEIMVGLITFYEDYQYTKKCLVESARESERANQAKSKFLSSMSHELRTPLNSILGFAQLLDLQLSDPAHKENVSYILSSGEYLLNLINDVLEIARIEKDRYMPELEMVLLEESVNGVVTALRLQAEDKKILIHLDNFQNIAIFANQRAVTQILTNLITNAIKYGRERGNVWVRYETRDDQYLRICVHDDGIGIKKEFHEHIFESFNRLGAEHSGIEGSGIGLVITKSITEKMGGTISFTSREGEGSSFCVDLQLKPSTSPQAVK